MGKTSTSISHKKAVNKTAKPLSTPKLTSKQIKFCQELAKGKNITQAAKKAGYSKHTAAQMGYENLKKPYIAEIVKQNALKAQEKFNYTLEQQFNELNEAGDFARKTGNASALLSSVVQKGKLCGLYTEKHEIQANVVSGFAVDQFLEKFNAKQ